MPTVLGATHHLAPTIFHENWWLDAAAAGHWEAAEVLHGGRRVAWLPYTVSRRHGFRVGGMPTLTHLLGPALDEGTGTGNTRWLRRMDLMLEVAAGLPKLGSFSQICHPGIADVLGLQAAGFDTAVQFSAEIASAPEQQLWRAMRDKTRNVIRRAAEQLVVQELDDPVEFTGFYRDNLALAGQRSYFRLDLIAAVFGAARLRGQARIITAQDAQRRTVAAVLLVWDRERAWYLLSSRHPVLGGNGAVSLLIWHAMVDAARRHLIFDFDGVAGLGMGRFLAGFGADIRPRIAVTRLSEGFRLARALSAAWHRPQRNHFIPR